MTGVPFPGEVERNSFEKCCISNRLDGTDDYAVCVNEGAPDDSCGHCSDECIQNKDWVSSEIWRLLCGVSANNVQGLFSFCFFWVVTWGYGSYARAGNTRKNMVVSN